MWCCNKTDSFQALWDLATSTYLGVDPNPTVEVSCIKGSNPIWYHDFWHINDLASYSPTQVFWGVMSESNYPDCPDFLVLPRLVHPSEGFKKGNQSQWRLVVKPAKNRIPRILQIFYRNLTQMIQILQQILQPVRLVTLVFRTPITAGRNERRIGCY